MINNLPEIDDSLVLKIEKTFNIDWYMQSDLGKSILISCFETSFDPVGLLNDLPGSEEIIVYSTIKPPTVN